MRAMKIWLLVAVLTGCGYTTKDDGLSGTVGAGGSAGAQAGSGGAAGQAGVAGLGGAAGSAQEAGAGGLAGSGGDVAGQGGDAGTGGSDAGSGGAAGDGGGAGAPVCNEATGNAKMCGDCLPPYWFTSAKDSRLVFKDTPGQLDVTFCGDTPCGVEFKDSGSGTIGTYAVKSTCDLDIVSHAAGVFGGVTVTLTSKQQTMKIIARVGVTSGCDDPTLSPVKFPTTATAKIQDGQASSVNALGCAGFDSPVVNCPTFPEENVMFCEQCITDTCDLIPLEQAHTALLAHLGEMLRRQVGAVVSGSCKPASSAPAGDACVTPW